MRAVCATETFLSTLCVNPPRLTGVISIHALLAESDSAANFSSGKSITISIHALLAESDEHATSQAGPNVYFYPRSPCGERQMDNTRILALIQFLSTLSLRRATLPRRSTLTAATDFYPRSPCGERLNSMTHTLRFFGYFYPRSPCGERPSFSTSIISVTAFLSTLSLRRATN